MFQLLYPLGLLAALGVIVPVIVHLWNVKNGKTLKIGSIALLGSPSNQRSRNLKITDWPLLLLRCLLILLIALLLAAPVYQVKQSAADRPGWIVMERNDIGSVWKNHRKQMDSLLIKGFELHAFEPNFPTLELKDTATVFSKSPKTRLSYFSLISQLDYTLGAGFKVYAYTGNQLSRFLGPQPLSRLDLKWQIAPVNDSLKATWETKTGLTANTTAKGTYYTTATTVKDTSIQNIAIYQSSRVGGASYARAAVLALADFEKRKVNIHEISSLKDVKRAGEFVFWFSDDPLKEKDLSGLPAGTTVFSYAGTQASKVRSLIIDKSGNALDQAKLYQRTAAKDAGTAVWTDGFGAPLLTKKDFAALTWYQYYSRFSPQWTSMVWTDGMLTALLPILSPQEGAKYGFTEEGQSMRAVTAANVFTGANLMGSGTVVQAGYATKPIDNYIWWLVVAALLVERWLSYRKTTHTL